MISVDRPSYSKALSQLAGGKGPTNLDLGEQLVPVVSFDQEWGPWPAGMPFSVGFIVPAVAAQYSYALLSVAGQGDAGFQTGARCIFDDIAVVGPSAQNVCIWDVLTGGGRIAPTVSTSVMSMDMGLIPETQVTNAQTFPIPRIGALTAGYTNSAAALEAAVHNLPCWPVNNPVSRRFGLILSPGCQFMLRSFGQNELLQLWLRGRYYYT